MRRSVLSLVLFGLLAGACSGADDDSTTPSVASSVASSSTRISTTNSTAATSSTFVSSTTSPPTSTVDDQPGQVTALRASTGGGSGEVLLVWSQNPEPDVVAYVVERAVTPGGPRTEVGRMTRAQVTQFPVAPFVDSTARVGYYRVAAIDRKGSRGPFSTEVCGAAPGNHC
jgi:hypothetical protein